MTFTLYLTTILSSVKIERITSKPRSQNGKRKPRNVHGPSIIIETNCELKYSRDPAPNLATSKCSSRSPSRPSCDPLAACRDLDAPWYRALAVSVTSHYCFVTYMWPALPAPTTTTNNNPCCDVSTPRWLVSVMKDNMTPPSNTNWQTHLCNINTHMSNLCRLTDIIMCSHVC